MVVYRYIDVWNKLYQIRDTGTGVEISQLVFYLCAQVPLLRVVLYKDGVVRRTCRLAPVGSVGTLLWDWRLEVGARRVRNGIVKGGSRRRLVRVGVDCKGKRGESYWRREWRWRRGRQGDNWRLPIDRKTNGVDEGGSGRGSWRSRDLLPEGFSMARYTRKNVSAVLFASRLSNRRCGCCCRCYSFRGLKGDGWY